MKLFFASFLIIISSCSLLEKKIQTSNVFISMKRTPCYGTCPQYQVTIFSNGLIKYEGKRFVDKIGCFHSKLSRKKIENIVSLVNKINYFKLDSVYSSNVTDLPSVVTEVIVNGKSHRVVDEKLFETELNILYDEIDKLIIEVDEWKMCH